MTAAMNIVQDFIPKGRKNRPGRANPMRYVTIHNTGNQNPGTDAKRHAAHVKSDAAANAPVSWHYTVDEHGAYQHLPDGEDAFHCGDGAGPGNRQSIGIEICMNSDGDLRKATGNAAALAAGLCKKYNIPLENVVQHHRWSGKNCPQMLRAGQPYGWGAFMANVQEMMTDKADVAELRFNNLDEIPEWGKAAVRKLIDRDVFADTSKLDLSIDMLRILVFNNRMGIYD